MLTKKQVQDAIDATRTMTEASVVAGVAKSTFNKYAKKHGLFEVAENKTYCYLDDILMGKHPEYQTLRLKKRLLKECIIEYACVICGNTGTHNGKPLTLQLDHINGVNNDHRLSNLRLLCPNCHTQTDTYAGKNK